MSGADKKYDVFLSYSHTADQSRAPAVQRGLQSYAKQWRRPRALRVFLDKSSMSANEDLWASLEVNLRESRYFVLMASTDSAQSPWVRREISYWREHSSRETFLIALTDGAIVWDASAGDFDWDRTTALPRELAGWFASEPLWVDLSWARDKTDLSMRKAQFRSDVGTLASTVHGRSKDELDAEDIRQHRKTVRLRSTAIVLLSAFLVAALVLGLVAWGLRNDTIDQRNRALSRDLASRSETLGNTDPVLARLLSVAAWRISPTSEARAGMLRAAARPGVATIATKAKTVDSVLFSPDGKTLATISDDGRIRLWDMATHNQAGEIFDSATKIRLATFSPDGSTLATASDDGLVRLWDVPARKQAGDPLTSDKTLSPIIGIPTVAFSPDGRTLAIGTSTGAVQLWDVGTRQQVGAPLTGHTMSRLGWVTPGVAFSPDGATLATAATDGTVRFWNAATHQQIGDPLSGHPADAAAIVGPTVVFSPDGKVLASAGIEGTVRLWDPATHQPIGAPLAGYTKPDRVNLRPSVAFSLDGKTLATGSYDGTIRLWNTARQELLGEPLAGHTRPVSSVAFGPDGSTLVSGAQDGTIRLWNVSGQLQLSNPVTGFSGPVYSLVFSPDGKTLVGGGDNGGAVIGPGSASACSTDGWGVCTANRNRRRTTQGNLSTLYPGPDEKFVPPTYGPTVGIVDVGQRRRVATLATGDVSAVLSVAFTSDGRTLAAGGVLLGADDNLDGGTLLWDFNDRKPIGDMLTDRGSFRSLRFGPNGTTLISGMDRSGDKPAVRLWDTSKHQEAGAFASNDTVYSVALSPDGKTVAAGRRDGTVLLWDLETKQQVGVLTGHTGPVGSVAFSPDGKTMATTGDDGTIRLWDSATHRQTSEPFVGHTGPVYSVAFSPDGTMLATGSVDSTVRLWDIATRSQVNESYLRHYQSVRSVTFSPDGRTLATAGDDSSVRLWDVGYTVDVVATLCATTRRPLTPEEWARYVPDLPYQPVCQ